jgi:cell wall-associated NlpC family hydrolase
MPSSKFLTNCLYCFTFRQFFFKETTRMTIKTPLRHLLVTVALCSGLTAWGAELSSAQTVEGPTSESTTFFTRIQEITDRASSLVTKAGDFIGVRYKRGGNTPEQGLDCSGLVRLVFKDALDIHLPRTSLEISRAGEKIEASELQPGDLVFYNTLKRGFSHVGIYVGDNKFIHSPSTGGRVRVESMDVTYWKKRFNGARRINTF